MPLDLLILNRAATPSTFSVFSLSLPLLLFVFKLEFDAESAFCDTNEEYFEKPLILVILCSSAFGLIS